MRLTLTLQEIETFVAVAHARNFRLAADRSNISQPALSRRIQGAESKLNTRLFDRNTRSVELTATGAMLLPIAQRILGEVQSSLVDLSDFIGGQRGNITIASLPSVASTLLPVTMTEFEKRHPFITFKILPSQANNVLQAVSDGIADFGISIDPSKPNAIEFENLINDEFVLICAADDPLASTQSQDWAVFTTRSFIAAGASSSTRLTVEKALDSRSLSVTPHYEAANSAVTVAMVRAGLGIAAISRLSLQHVNAKGIAILTLRGNNEPRRVGVLTRRGRTLSAAATVFLEMLRLQAKHEIGVTEGQNSVADCAV